MASMLIYVRVKNLGGGGGVLHSMERRLSHE